MSGRCSVERGLEGGCRHLLTARPEAVIGEDLGA